MSSIITSILSSTVGLLWNKARDKTAEKLKDGDVTDARIREIVLRELNDVKTRLDGLSRKDLLSSNRFLKEGVDLLNVALDKTKTNDEETDTSGNEAEGGGGEASGMSSSFECDILNDALELSDAMKKVKIESDEEFEAAKKRFEEARKTATHAFCNEALNIEDRIFAAKLRVVSEILECLESPKTAIAGCLSFLRELHSLPAIQNMFSVFLNGGFKSLLNKEKRVENVKSVMLINCVLYEFVLKFSNKYCSGLVWPTIKLVDAGGSFNPILDWRKVSSRIFVIGFQPPNVLKHTTNFDSGLGLPKRLSAVNSHGEILVVDYDQIEIISRTKKPKVVTLPDPGESEWKYVAAIAVGENNHVYVLRLIRKRTVTWSYVLCILDENYKVQRNSAFSFDTVDVAPELRITVNKNNDIIMNKDGDPHVYVFDSSGHLKHKFERDERDSRDARNMSISANNEIMIPARDPQAVHVYTEEGILKSTIKVPEGHDICDATFSYFMYKIIILTFNLSKFSYSLLVYSETGELESSIFVSNTKLPPSLVSHPSGPVAIVKFGTITYI